MKFFVWSSHLIRQMLSSIIRIVRKVRTVITSPDAILLSTGAADATILKRFEVLFDFGDRNSINPLSRGFNNGYFVIVREHRRTTTKAVSVTIGIEGVSVP